MDGWSACVTLALPIAGHSYPPAKCGRQKLQAAIRVANCQRKSTHLSLQRSNLLADEWGNNPSCCLGSPRWAGPLWLRLLELLHGGLRVALNPGLLAAAVSIWWAASPEFLLGWSHLNEERKEERKREERREGGKEGLMGEGRQEKRGEKGGKEGRKEGKEREKRGKGGLEGREERRGGERREGRKEGRINRTVGLAEWEGLAQSHPAGFHAYGGTRTHCLLVIDSRSPSLFPCPYPPDQTGSPQTYFPISSFQSHFPFWGAGVCHPNLEFPILTPGRQSRKKREKKGGEVDSASVAFGAGSQFHQDVPADTVNEAARQLAESMETMRSPFEAFTAAAEEITSDLRCARSLPAVASGKKGERGERILDKMRDANHPLLRSNQADSQFSLVVKAPG
ncbi:hypothetical protein L345_08518, partial [Ophiophagus hannah]